MDLKHALRGPVVGIVLASATWWIGNRIWDDHSTLVWAAAQAVLGAAIAVNGQLSKPAPSAVSQSNTGPVAPGGIGNFYLAGDMIVHYDGGGTTHLREAAYIIRVSDPDLAFETFLRIREKIYVLGVLIEDGAAPQAAALLRRLVHTFKEQAAVLISAQGAHGVLGWLLMHEMTATERYEIAKALNTQQLTEVLENLRSNAAALLLADICSEDPTLASELLHALTPGRIAELLRAGSRRTALTRTVANLDWQTRRRILKQLPSDDPIAFDIRTAVSSRRQLILGACIAVPSLDALVFWAMSSNDRGDETKPSPGTTTHTTRPSQTTAAPRSTAPKPQPAGYPATPRLADYHSRWQANCPSWNDGKVPDRLVDVCDTQINGQPYQVVYVQYPLNEKAFERGDPAGPIIGDWTGPDGRKGRYKFYLHDDTGWSAWLQEDDQTRVALLLHSYVQSKNSTPPPPPAIEKTLRSILSSHGYRLE